MHVFIFAAGYLCSAGQQVFSADSDVQWETVPGSGSQSQYTLFVFLTHTQMHSYCHHLWINYK